MKYLSSLFLVLFLVISAGNLATNKLAAQKDTEASDEAGINPETIKENIKKRIEQVVKTQSTSDSKKKVAFIGTLSSVTTNSFTLETLNGEVKQASNSAEITVIELPKNKEVKFEDISIGDYIVALGYINETTKVLEARRILTQKTPPTTDTKKTYFGIITKVDTKKSLITLLNPKSNQEKEIYYTKKTTISQANGLQKQKLDPKQIPLNSKALFVYGIDDSDNVATTILIKADPDQEIIADPSPSPSTSSSPSPSAKKAAPSPSPKAVN